MLKEIYEQPDAVAETIGERVRHGRARSSRTSGSPRWRSRTSAAWSSSRAAPPTTPASSAATSIEEWARLPCEPDIASEWRYRNPVLSKDTLVVGITQSGETADTIAAMRLAREKGAQTLAITNMMGAQITREVDAVLYTRAGIEMGVAATKTFTAQVTLMYLLALKPRRGAADAAAGRDLAAARRASRACRARSRRTSRATTRSTRSRSAPLPEAVLPLPRTAHRPAGVPRGRAQAEGDLVHPDRGLFGRRDEARPDRAARRARPPSSASRPTRTSTTRSSRTSRRRAPAAPR